MDIENIIKSKSKEEKEKIAKMLETKVIDFTSLTREDLINCISGAKVNLNDMFSNCSNLKTINFSNVNEATIFAKSQKIDNMISYYNNSNTFTTYTFKNNLVTFDTLKKIKKLQLNIENFNYELPLEFKIKIYCSDKSVIEEDIVPFNYNGLYNEFFIPTEKIISTFITSNRNNILFYSCLYTNKKFEIGNELDLEKNKDYSFNKEGKILINNKFIKNENLLIKYQPTTEAFEIEINKMVSKIELIISNDLLKVEDQLEKKIEVFNYD
ncbi:hypothetical protein [Cetobacterium sp.]|uniref:hypothetical protein n=1 Tax=Cetobacterium sp. TaxID=2071632 RepID=UPI003F3375D0